MKSIYHPKNFINVFREKLNLSNSRYPRFEILFFVQILLYKDVNMQITIYTITTFNIIWFICISTFVRFKDGFFEFNIILVSWP